MNEPQQMTETTETPKNLKGIFQQLKEIDEVLQSPQQSLDILVNGDRPVDAATKDLELSGPMPSMENIVHLVNSIRRTAGDISKSTNRLLGN